MNRISWIWKRIGKKWSISLWAVAVIFMAAGMAAGCGSSDTGDSDSLNVGEEDAGVEDGGDEDAGESDACQAESDEEFCGRLDVECGSLSAEDDCGEERLVHCEDFDGFQCDEPRICAHAADDDDLDTNLCRCPELGDEPAAQICEIAGAECGTVDAGGVCEGWDGLGEVQCGECEDGVECGVEIENVCGCPCEIDGECYADGDASSDDACLICDSEESDDEFVEAPDGTECEEGGVCEAGECVCGDDTTECGDECVDVDADRNHCGECDNACGDDQVCSDGECEDSCPEGESICEEECVDQHSDLEHCGECENACETDVDDAEVLCDEGECIIVCDDDDAEVCEDECTDTSDDPDHCGACGDECTTDVAGAVASCDDGECAEVCQVEDEEICDDECVDTGNDDDHCGECGVSCGINEVCNEGTCVDFTGECTDDDDCGSAQQCCNGQCLPAVQPCN